MVCVTRRLVLGGATVSIAGAAIGPTAIAATATPNTPPSTGLLDDVFNVIETHTGLSRAAIVSKSREPEIVWARQRAIYLYKLLAGQSVLDIGRRFGGRSHFTVIHACRKVDVRRDRDPALDREIDDLIQACIVEAVRNGHRLRPDFNRQFVRLTPIVVEMDDVWDQLWG